MSKKQLTDFSGLEGFDSYAFHGRGMMSPDFVLLAPKTKSLCFSSLLEEKLGTREWDTVVMAFNRKTGAIALKQCDPEEYGCRKFSRINVDSDSRRITIKGMIKFFEAEDSCVRKYKPEKRADNLVVLNPVTEGYQIPFRPRKSNTGQSERF